MNDGVERSFTIAAYGSARNGVGHRADAYRVDSISLEA